MADLRDFTGKNRKFTGTIGERISTGTTAERDTATFGGGTLRFNSTTNLLEYYTGTEWKAIDAPPTITNFNIDAQGATTSTFIDRTLSGNTSIVITGSLYSSGAVVSFRGNGGANFDATTTTVNTANQVTAVVPYSSFLAAQEPYSIRVTNISGLFAQLQGCLAVDAQPVFATASGTLGTIRDGTRSSYSLSSAAATDVDGDTITYSITSGSLPTGLSINSSTGAISGTASAVASDTTSTFTVSAATTNQTSTRSFSITVNAPVVTTFSYTGSEQTFSVPVGVTAVVGYVWGGGGGGGTNGGWSTSYAGGGGGAAEGTINTTSISTLKVIVGQSGAPNDGNSATSVRDAFGGGGGLATTADNQYSGGGAGLSGIFNGTFTHANSLLIAGGGGGGGNTNSGSVCPGGAGGGTNGVDGQASSGSGSRGQGGTQSAGGARGAENSNSEANGSALQGGKDPNSGYGGGGGGGYYGGGAGSYNGSTSSMGGGGGGSGYAHPTLVSSATLYAGSGTTPGNSSGAYRGGFGDGGSAGGGAGDNGIVVLTY